MLELFLARKEPDDDEENIAWLREAWKTVQPFPCRGNCVNTLAQGEGEDRVGQPTPRHLQAAGGAEDHARPDEPVPAQPERSASALAE
jgi:hypothetical protein